MRKEELENLYNRVVAGVTVVKYEDEFYFIKDPTPVHKQISQYECDSAYADFLRNKVPSAIEIEFLLEDRDIWNQTFQRRLDYLQSYIEASVPELEQNEFRSNQKLKIRQDIHNAEDEISLLERRKTSLRTNTAEYLSQLEKYKSLVYMLTYDDEGERVWDTIVEFKFASENFITLIINEVFFNDLVNESNIRELARSEPWRSTWIASTKVGQLFKGPVCYMTDLQRAVVSWSLLYDSVYESTDCPSEDIIKDDILLDAWLVKQHEKSNRERDEASADGMISKNSRISGSQEVGIVVDSFEDAQRVYKLNTAENLSKVRKREDMIAKEGSVKEGHLPDIALDLQMRKNQIETQGIKMGNKRG